MRFDSILLRLFLTFVMSETGLWFSFLAMSLFGFRVLYALYNKFGSVSSKSLGSAVIVYSFNI